MEEKSRLSNFLVLKEEGTLSYYIFVISSFEIAYKELALRYEALEKSYNELLSELRAALVKIGELEEKLGLNSKNSSIPSSKELYKIKKKQKAVKRSV